MKNIFLLLMVPFLLYAEDDLSSLLDKYESESELHNKTKIESAGHLIVYSRSDLDMMQAQSLQDILKSTRFFTELETSTGAYTLQRSGAFCTNSGCIRVYVNNQEMSSAMSGSALVAFSDYDLDHIDHIELYIGGSGVRFGNEYGFVTVKLYTKEPSREKGTQVGVLYGTNKSYSMNAFNAGITDNGLEYFVYANKNKKNKGSLEKNELSIPRYSDNLNFFTTIKKEEDFTVELSYYEHAQDGMVGFGKEATPDKSEYNYRYSYISLTKYFGELEFQASYALEDTSLINQDTSGIEFYDTSTISKLENHNQNNIAKLGLQHNTQFGNHSFFYGGYYQNKSVDITQECDNGECPIEFSGIDSIDILSAYLEYSYNINEKNLIIATGKLENYKYRGYNRTENIYQNRIGLVSLLSNSFTFKAFASDNYIHPSIKEMSSFSKVINGNVELLPMDVHNYSAELRYNYQNHTFNFMYMQMHISDPIKRSKDKVLYNDTTINAVFNDYGFDYEYKFDTSNKLLVQYYITDHNRPFVGSPESGGYVKLFNRYGNFDFYNELIYRRGYESYVVSGMNIEDGYDLSSTVSYHYNKNMTLSLKGYNLLDKAIASPIRGLYPVESVEREVYLHMEYFF